MTTCLRCGKCCILKAQLQKETDKQKLTNKDCKFLIRLPSGRTHCRAYATRHKSKIGLNMRCIEREDQPYNYEGCPFNRDEWEMIEHE